MNAVQTRVTRVTRHAGRRGITTIGAITVDVAYPGQPTATVTFVGEDGGKIVRLLTGTGVARVIADPYRFGRFGTEWITRYYGVTA